MKVRVVNCSIAEAWYREVVGEEFHVVPYDDICWLIPYPFEYWNLHPLLLLRSDCKELKRDG